MPNTPDISKLVVDFPDEINQHRRQIPPYVVPYSDLELVEVLCSHPGDLTPGRLLPSETIRGILRDVLALHIEHHGREDGRKKFRRHCEEVYWRGVKKKEIVHPDWIMLPVELTADEPAAPRAARKPVQSTPATAEVPFGLDDVVMSAGRMDVIVTAFNLFPDWTEPEWAEAAR